MKCKYCGGRKFRITVEDYQTIEYNDKDEIIFDETTDFGDMIEEHGYYCLKCDRVVTYEELIKEN